MTQERRPLRRPPGGRPRAPRPGPLHTRPRSAFRRALYRGLEAGKRGIYPRAGGRWLRGRLDRGRRFDRVDLALDRVGPGLEGLRIAFLSDVHAGSFMREADLLAIFGRVAALEPDLVCLGGDLIEDRARQVLLLGKGISLLRPPLGIFAVPGNHEYEAERSLRIWRSALEEHGVTILINSGRRLERGDGTLWLAGVDDLDRGAADLAQALRGAREEEPIVLLSHHPDLFRESAWAGVDLTLAGHTHGGQILLLGWSPFTHSRLGYWQGRFEESGAHLYVSGGVGIASAPLRIGSAGEAPLIRLLRGG